MKHTILNMKRVALAAPLALILAALGCSPVKIHQAGVMTQAEIEQYNKAFPPKEDPAPPVDPDTPVTPDDPDTPAPSDDRITDGSVLFVRQTALGLKDGSSWNNALDAKLLRELIAQKMNEDGSAQDDAASAEQAARLDGVKIYLAGGKYILPAVSGDTKSTLKLEWTGYQKQVVLSFYGGYNPASSGIDLTQRDVDGHETILSGDLNGNNLADPNDGRLIRFGNQVDALFDGLTFAHGYSDENGGALYLAAGGSGNATVRLMGCIVCNNTVQNEKNGGALYVNKSLLIAENCVFRNNSANNGAVLYVNNASADVRFTGCTFTGNLATKCGGVLNQGLGKASFTDCRFLDNSNPSYGGGAIHCNGSGASLTCQNCLFTGNQSGAHGGALSLQDGTVTLDGCTFQSNNSATANSGSGDNGGTLAMLDARGILHVKGCTFSGNSSAGTGAGIYQKQGRLYVSNTKFLNNTSNNRGIIRLCHGLCFMDKVTVSGSGISGDWGLAFQFSGMDAFCANNLTVANSSASAKSCMPLNGEGKILLVNSTLADSGKGGTMRVEISNNYKFLNSILVSTNSDPALLFNTSKSATVTSLGNCIFGAISGEGDTRVFTPGTGDKKDVAFESLNMNWDAEAGLYTWSGTREGHTRIATASIEGIARTGLPLSVTGTYTDNKQEKTAFTVNDASAAFVDWAKGLDANAFTVDARGVSRGTTATCGAWQAD